jgi:hypothetical protein
LILFGIIPLQEGADPKQKTSTGKTAADLAKKKGKSSWVQNVAGCAKKKGFSKFL